MAGRYPAILIAQPVPQVGGSADVDKLIIDEPCIHTACAGRINSECAEECIDRELVSPRICEAILRALP